MEETNFTFETINKTLHICVSPEHKFGTDAFLLSDFAGIRRKDMAIDLGTGCGIIPLLWFREMEDAPKEAWGMDIQPQAIEQMKKTVEACSLEGRLKPLHGDLKDLPDCLERGRFTLVTCNPPYKAANTGILNDQDAHTIARHEIMCGMDDVCAAAAKLLTFGGRLCMCQRPERVVDTLCSMRSHGIEPKRLRFVQKKGNTQPWLFLVEGRKGGKPYIQVEPPFLIQEPDSGEFSEELRRVYRLL